MKGRPKDERFAHLVNVSFIFDQLEEPVAVCCVPIKNRTNQTVVFNHQALVDTAGRITQYDILASFCIGKITSAKQITSRDFQLGGCILDDKGVLLAKKGIGQNSRLLVKWGDKAKKLAIKFNAFAKRENVRIRCLQLCINGNSTRNL